MNILISIIVGVLSSFAASGLFLWFISHFRPNILISEKIAEGKTSKEELAYKIKVINKTKRSVVNIKAQLHLIIPTVVPGGTILKSRKIELKRPDPLEISKYDPKDTEGNYAFIFLTYEDLKEILKNENNTYLKFRIFATDSFSGFGKTFNQDYHTIRDSFVKGAFEPCDSFEIK